MSEESKKPFFLKRIKISVKMILIISLIILISFSGMISLVTYFFSGDYKIRIQENNLSVARILSQKVHADYIAIVEKMNLMGMTMKQKFKTKTQKSLFINLFFKNDKNFLYLAIINKNGTVLKIKDSIKNSIYFRDNKLDVSDMDRIITVNKKHFYRTFNNDALVINASRQFKTPVMAVAIPFEKNDQKKIQSILIGFIKLDRFLLAFKKGAGITINYLVSHTGDILAHPNSDIVLNHGNFGSEKVVIHMFKSPVGNGFIRYKDSNNIWCLGSFQKIDFLGLVWFQQ